MCRPRKNSERIIYLDAATMRAYARIFRRSIPAAGEVRILSGRSLILRRACKIKGNKIKGKVESDTDKKAIAKMDYPRWITQDGLQGHLRLQGSWR
jgi:hypothetical protein